MLMTRYHSSLCIVTNASQIVTSHTATEVSGLISKRPYIATAEPGIHMSSRDQLEDGARDRVIPH